MKILLAAFTVFVLALVFFHLLDRSTALHAERSAAGQPAYGKYHRVFPKKLHPKTEANTQAGYASPSPTTELANPASSNCIAKGGTLTMMTRGDGGQFGLCNFEDDMACEEWALYRGNCPVGGVKTIGYDTSDQMYCAWLGGQTLAVPNSQCTLPNGDTCSTVNLYNGNCN